MRFDPRAVFTSSERETLRAQASFILVAEADGTPRVTTGVLGALVLPDRIEDGTGKKLYLDGFSRNKKKRPTIPPRVIALTQTPA